MRSTEEQKNLDAREEALKWLRSMLNDWGRVLEYRADGGTGYPSGDRTTAAGSRERGVPVIGSNYMTIERLLQSQWTSPIVVCQLTEHYRAAARSRVMTTTAMIQRVYGDGLTAQEVMAVAEIWERQLGRWEQETAKHLEKELAVTSQVHGKIIS